MQHNLSINLNLIERARRHRPAHRFEGASTEDWRRWRNQLLPAVKATLGTLPDPPDVHSEIIAEWREDGLIKQRIMLAVEPGLWATGYVFRPEGKTGRLPAILCCHGHGPFGKETIMGNRTSPDLRENIERHNYDYGLQMAKAGFVTMAIDWRGFGERDDRRRPICNDVARGRDQCDVHYVRASLLGMTLLGMNVHDGLRAVDYLCNQPFVDPDRLGVMGLSFGGTMTTWLSICDERIKAANVICYSVRFADYAIRDANSCGSQITPGLFALCDVSDLQGLIAPRPLLIEIGIYDDCFPVDSALISYRELENIYSVAGATKQLELDLFEGGRGHAWSSRRTVAFFQRHLAGKGV